MINIMVFRDSVFVLTLTYLFIYVNGDLNIGDNCHHEQKNIAGQCVLLENCDIAKKDIQNNKYPQTCGFQGLVPIVCCPLIRPGLIAEKKCWEYSESVYKIMPSIDAFVSKEPLNISTCSITTNTELSFGDGCAHVKNKEYPHMVVLGYGRLNNKKWKCAGTLISDQFILTAAHCLNLKEYGEVKFIRLGELNLEALNDADPQDFYVKEIFKHPNYVPPSRYNDIALLKMDRPTRFNDFIRPACLHVVKDFPGMSFTVTGWKQIFVGDEKQSERLQKVKKYRLSNEKCSSAYSSRNDAGGFLNGIDFERQLCARNGGASVDLCEMDTGGPLQIFHPQVHCMYSIIGVNSFGKFHSSISNTPYIYTRVSYYIDWIEQIVWS